MTTKITADNIADSAITSAKISDGTIATADIADDAISAAKLAAGAGSTDWQAVIAADGSTVTTMVSGRGYFINTTSAAGILKFPISASRGDYVEIKDYAQTFGTNNVTLQRNGHNLDGTAANGTLSTNGQIVKFVYMDSTRGWSPVIDDTTAGYGKTYISATGGTISNVGDYKVHAFTGDGNFIVSALGNSSGGGSDLDYVVVAGGGGSAGNRPGDTVGGAGAGGFRLYASPDVGAAPTYPAGPLNGPGALTASITTYPVTVGAGGTGGDYSSTMGTRGSNSVFSTITSTGGGSSDVAGSSFTPTGPGGSGGGNPGGNPGGASGAAGNTPPVSPPQGNPGCTNSPSPDHSAGGGGGATAAGGNGSNSRPGPAGTGGAGAGIPDAFGTNGEASSCKYYFAGGGGGAGSAPSNVTAGTGGLGGGGNGAGPSPEPQQAGTANTGGGAGAGGPGEPGVAGGKGIVIIRYKYQN